MRGQEDRRLCSRSLLQPILDQKVQSHSCTAGCIEPTQQAGPQSGPPPQQTPDSGPSADATLYGNGITTALGYRPALSHDKAHQHLSTVHKFTSLREDKKRLQLFVLN